MPERLRPREASDDDFLLELFRTTRPELEAAPLPLAAREQLIGTQWRAQEAQHRTAYPRALDTIVVRAGRPVGRLLRDDTGSEIRILDLAVHPAHRGRGIGTRLLRAVCADAAARGVPVRLSVLAHNPAHRLYLREGFGPSQRPGDQPAAPYVELEWSAP